MAGEAIADARALTTLARATSAQLDALLERHYEAWIAGWDACPVLTVDTDGLDVVAHEVDRRRLIECIVAHLAAQGAQRSEAN